MKRSWSAAEAWHCERPGEDFEDTELKRSWREVKACYYEESLGEAIYW